MTPARTVVASTALLLLLVGLSDGATYQPVPLPTPPQVASAATLPDAPIVRLAPIRDGRNNPDVATLGDLHAQAGTDLLDYISRGFSGGLQRAGFNVVNGDAPASLPGSVGLAVPKTVLVTLKWADARSHASRVDGSLEISVEVRDPSGARVYNASSAGRGNSDRGTESETLQAIGAALAAAADQVVGTAMSDPELAKAAKPSPIVVAKDNSNQMPATLAAAGGSPTQAESAASPTQSDAADEQSPGETGKQQEVAANGETGPGEDNEGASSAHSHAASKQPRRKTVKPQTEPDGEAGAGNDNQGALPTQVVSEASPTQSNAAAEQSPDETEKPQEAAPNGATGPGDDNEGASPAHRNHHASSAHSHAAGKQPRRKTAKLQTTSKVEAGAGEDNGVASPVQAAAQPSPTQGEAPAGRSPGETEKPQAASNGETAAGDYIVGRRIALVVGNSNYKYVRRLRNTSNDANLVANTLRSLGFELVGGKAQIDLDKPAFDGAVRDFGKELRGSAIALFYYAGHAVEVEGENYLIPISANPEDESDVDFQMVDVQRVLLHQMEIGGGQLNVLALDSCRDNPFGGGPGMRSASGGLAEMQAPRRKGIAFLISFATQPGSTAADGDGEDSPYAEALTQIIRKPGLDILHAFNQVDVIVEEKTNDKQEPWMSVSPIKGEFYFAGPGAGEKPQIVNHSGESAGPPTVAREQPPKPEHVAALEPSTGAETGDLAVKPTPKPLAKRPARPAPAKIASRTESRRSKPRTPYHIDIDKDYTLHQANEMVARIGSLGYTAEIKPAETDDGETVYQIKVGGYGTEDEASEAQDDFWSQYNERFGSAPLP